MCSPASLETSIWEAGQARLPAVFMDLNETKPRPGRRAAPLLTTMREPKRPGVPGPREESYTEVMSTDATGRGSAGESHGSQAVTAIGLRG